MVFSRSQLVEILNVTRIEIKQALSSILKHVHIAN